MVKNVESFEGLPSKEQREKLETAIGNRARLEKTFWTSLITIQATLLGISMAFSQHFSSNIPIFLKASWVFLLVSMGLGILSFKLSVEKESGDALKNFMFSMDTNELNAREERRGFSGEEEAAGMITAAFLKLENPEINACFTEKAKEMAKKYKHLLPSEKYFKPIKVNLMLGNYRKFKKWLQRNLYIVVSLFYTATFIAFLLFFISAIRS